MNRAEIKGMAKEQIKGNVGILFVITLVMAAVSALANLIPVVGSIASVVVLIPGMSLGLVAIYLNLTQGAKPSVGDLFAQMSKFLTAFVTTLLVGLFTALWSLLFVIPGIIKSYSYAMAMYILADNPEIGALEAINRSKAMMHGHKMELFVLHLSFIGWCLLGSITFGIAYIWIVPYMSATVANFYNSIKGGAETVA